MQTVPGDIQVVLLGSTQDDVIKSVVKSLSDGGVSCRDSSDSRDLPGDLFKKHACDLVITDARHGFTSHFDVPGGLPVIALVDPSQSPESLLAFSYVDDIATTDEIGYPVFIFRLQRLVDRYRNPLSAIRRHAPEFDLIRALVNSTNDQIYVKDLDHRFLFASDQFAQSNGLDISEVIGKDDIEIGSNPVDVYGSPELGWMGFWGQDDAAVEVGNKTEELNPEWRALLEDTRENRVFRVPLKNNKSEVYALLVVSSDMTNSGSNVVDLRARGKILDRALGAMKKAQGSQEVAERAVMEKNKLLAAASHDLRQPLHAMGLFIDVLERRINGEQEQELITKIKRSSEALSALFNSLLDISRLDAGVVHVNKEHFPINAMLDALRSEFSEIGAQKMLSVDIEHCNSTVCTDPVLLERILRNLILNAVTYTEEGSVAVKCKVIDGNLHLSVTDTGSGIAVEEQDEIFSEYYQIEQREHTRTKGLGLGLAIVRRLADLLDFKITLNSELGYGSCFSVSLPLGETSSAKATTDTDFPSVLTGQTIVIIDDESDILEGMASMLIDFNCSFITAESTAAALRILLARDIVPDVIIADYRLKHGHTGDEAIAQIREEFSQDIPAVIVTGDTSADRLKDATRSGCQLLHKPVKPNELVQAIAESVAIVPQPSNTGTNPN